MIAKVVKLMFRFDMCDVIGLRVCEACLSHSRSRGLGALRIV